MQARFAHVRRAVGIAKHFLAQALELALADIFEVGALGPLRRRFVEINRDAVALPDFAAHFFREHDAILDGDAFDGNERDHVGCAEPRMRAGVAREIDQLGGFADAAQRRLGDVLGFAGERDHAAIVVRVAFAVEQEDAGNFAHGRDDGVHFGGIAAFGEIRNAFDEALHGYSFFVWITAPRFMVRLQRFTPK